MLYVDALAHFAVDAVCAATLFSCGGADMTSLLLVYNTLAFSSQCLVGLVMDRSSRRRLWEALSCGAVLLGFILPLPAMVRAIAVALGNSVFHVTGGTLTLLRSKGKAGPLGVFVAPGAIGLTLGTLYPRLGWSFAAILTLCGMFFLIKSRGEASDPQWGTVADAMPDKGGLVACALLLAVAARAIGGGVASLPWKTTNLLSIIAVLFVFAGKLAGGFVCDKIGANKTALLSIPIAAVLIAFAGANMPLSLAGQFLLNLTMPVTLLLVYRALPDSPGFAFGLAASALWPGAIIGQLISLTGPALWILVIVSFTLGLVAILWAAKGEKR